jgi:pimeloyl-ACP methyl ester carboxylesterase
VKLVAGAALIATAQLLAYDRTAPMGTILVSTTLDAGAVVDDVRVVRSAEQQLIAEAFIVRPEVLPASCPGVLFLHWFAPPEPTSNRAQFLEEAKALARRGVVSMLPSTFWSSSERYRARMWQTDYTNSVDQAIRLRRVLQILRAQRCVDPQRLAIVGHDYGAMFGALVAAEEPDIKAAVLIAGVPTFSSWYEFGSSTGVPRGDELVKYREALAAIDPGPAMSRFRGASLFQFGTKDKYTPKDQYESFFAMAAGAKEVRTYDAAHDMSLPQIRADRTEWLAKQLGVK